MKQPKRVFISYSHKDEPLVDELDMHLASLKRRGLVTVWKDRAIDAGKEWENSIREELEQADIILLVVSAAFLASEYIWKVELEAAMRRHEAGTARIIPVIVRTCEWNHMPFARLQALPRDAKPVISWADRDVAWTDVTKGIARVVESMPDRIAAPQAAAVAASIASFPAPMPVASALSAPAPVTAAIAKVVPAPAMMAPVLAGVGLTPGSIAAGRKLDLRTQLEIATTLQRVLRSVRTPMENVALLLDMELGHLRDDDWLGLVRGVHAGMHGPSGDGANAVRKLVEAARSFAPGSTELSNLLATLA